MSSMSKLPLKFNSDKRKWMRVGKSHSPPNKSRRLSDSKSPEPNCPICLGPIESESFASGCFHSFCRTCLFEWSKVKAECPVCRRPFERIIFNVQSVDQYEFLNVTQRRTEFQAPSTFTFWTAPNRMPPHHRFMPPLHLYQAAPSLSIQINRSTHSDLSQIRRIGFGLGWHCGNSQSPHRQNRVFNSTSSSSNSNSSSSSSSSSSQPVGSVEHRRSLYDRDLWAKSTDKRRSRISSASFYRDNPALTHRLQPFVYRELTALINSEFEANFLAQRVMDGLLQHDIRSRSFRRIIENFLVANTDHFIHEFYSYATSPFELTDYDLNAKYVPKSQTVVTSTVPPVPPLGINYELDENEPRGVSGTLNSLFAAASSTSRNITCIDISDDSDDEGVIQVSNDAQETDECPPEDTPADVPTECNFNINIIDDFDNPQPGPSRVGPSSNIQVNIQCRTERPLLPPFMDSDDDESDVDVDSDARPHSFIPIFPTNPVVNNSDESNDSIVFLAEEKTQPVLIDISSDEEEEREEENEEDANNEQSKHQSSEQSSEIVRHIKQQTEEKENNQQNVTQSPGPDAPEGEDEKVDEKRIGGDEAERQNENTCETEAIETKVPSPQGEANGSNSIAKFADNEQSEDATNSI